MGESRRVPNVFKQAVRKAAVAYGVRNRRRKAAAILAFLQPENVKDVLLVGMMGDSPTQMMRPTPTSSKGRLPIATV
jgi:hypothetical protein